MDSVLAWWMALALAEIGWPLRAMGPRRPRWQRNLALAAMGGVVVACLEQPLVAQVAGRVPGLCRLLPRRARRLGAWLLMDYTMYAWHVATHKIPRLWRFHRIHHLDRDMDTTTALRFHLGEMLWSVPWRLAQVVVSGADEGVYRHWQRALALCILFQHSNWRLPVRVDRGLARWIITPRLHGVHHGRDDQDVNWGSTLAIWDLLHHTWRWKASAQPVGLDGEPDLPVPALLEAPWA